MKQDACRFCRLYAVFTGAFAALVGGATAAQLGFGLSKFGGHEYVMRVAVLSCVRTLGPGAAGSALLVALVVWAHPLPQDQMERELPALLKRAGLISLPGYAVAALIAILAALGVSHFGFGIPWASGRLALETLQIRDWLRGALATAVDAGLLVFLTWRYLPRLSAGRSSLPAKLMLAWTFGTGLRMSAALLVTMVLPG